MARTLWMIIAVLSLGLFILSIPYYIINLSSNLDMGLKFALMHQGISPTIYIVFQLINVILIVAGYSITAISIFFSKSDDRMALFVSISLITFGVAITSLDPQFSPLGSLLMYQPVWTLPVMLLIGMGLGLILLVFYLFPDGHFVPLWSRVLAIFWGVWLLSWLVFPDNSAAPDQLSPTARFVARMFMADIAMIHRTIENLRLYSLFLILAIWFGTGIFSQAYRYLRVSSPLQRRQTKWAVLGLIASVVLYFLARMAPPYLFIHLQKSGDSFLRYELITLPIATLALLLVPLSIGISIQRYKLWDVDFLINRTIVYGAVSAFLAAFYIVDVLVLQLIFTQLTGNQSTLFIAVSTLVIFALTQPLKRWMQRFVDRRFFREKLNFRQVFTSFSSEVRTIIDFQELLRTLVDRTAELFYIEYGAVYLLSESGEFELSESRNLQNRDMGNWRPGKDALERLKDGHVVSQPKDSSYPMLVPLIAPKTSSQQKPNAQLMGVLALGPLSSGLHYGREDQSMLLSLADQAGTAIYVARLIKESQEETTRRMEAEQRLEDYRNSPLGRAEALGQTILDQPETAIPQIHQLAQKAGKDPLSSSLIGNLPKVLHNFNAGPLASLAEGYNYLYESQYTTELSPIGLRVLLSSLSTLSEQEDASLIARHAQTIYQLCLDCYGANSIPQIIEIRGLREEGLFDEQTGSYEIYAPLAIIPEESFLFELISALRGLQPVAEALHAFERVDTSQDKLAYLASAVNSLRHVGHQARTELESADRPIIEHIIESWLAVITNAMAELQTSARIVCQLLTRNTWQGEMISLVLNLQNQGRGAALQIRVSLAPSPEYSVLDEVALVERLASGEEAQVQLRVRPRLATGADHFRARFIIQFTDPRGPDQVDNYADAVHLMTASSEFQFIPNPYVVGTPLKTGSPLFFGREDLVLFIQGNLSASHRNNLVLIGQRRTGKTSLLKQLPARLDDDILPVYLDGQTLGLDPGMPNFFLNLATEISFALEDRGFDYHHPELENFQSSPAATFENEFLPQVRRAIGDRHLLIMFDEFEELETAVKRGDLEPGIFGFLRHLIQHEPNLSVIFCGTHRLEQLASDYWNILFNISLYQHIASLGREEALRLVQEPVATYGMYYDDLALDKIWRVTAGHPYFLQLLCHSVVNRHNKTGRNYVTIADVNAALDEILASGEAHFVYLWAESSQEERLVLTAISRMIPLTGQVTSNQVLDFFNERGISLDRQDFQEALHQLALRDILQSGIESDTGIKSAGEAYRWKLGLLGLWVEKYKSLSRVIDEATSNKS